MSVKAGTVYRATNKFDLNIPAWVWLASFLLPFISGALISAIAYAVRFNTFWILFFKILLALSCYFISHMLIRKVKSRNRRLSYLIVLSVSLLSWYSFWVYNLSTFRMTPYFSEIFHPWRVLVFFSDVQHYVGGDLLEISDTLAFFLSVIGFAGIRAPYFCESCEVFYASRDLYVNQNAGFAEEFKSAAKGNYGFMGKYDFSFISDYGNLKTEGKKKISSYVKIKHFFCPKCIRDSIVDISMHVRETTRSKDDRGKEEDSNDYNVSVLESGIFVDEETNEILKSKCELLFKNIQKSDQKK